MAWEWQDRQPKEEVLVNNTLAMAIPNGALTVLAGWDFESFDVGAMHSLAVNPSRLTCTRAGRYMIGGYVLFAAAAAGLERLIALQVNGATLIYLHNNPPPGAGAGAALTTSGYYPLVVGDFVEIVVRQDSGAPLNIIAGAALFYATRIK